MQQLSKKHEGVDSRRWSRSWIYLAILGLLTALVFFQFIFSDGMLFSSDQMNGLDSKIFLKNTLQQDRQFPMWFNTRLSGMPTVDALFGDMFYLPSIVINYLFPIPRAISWRMIFHVFLAGAFFFVLLRKGFSMPPLIALVGAVFYMFNPQFLSHIYPGHDGKMFVIAWLPFLIWRVKRLCEIPTFRNMALLAFGIGMCILTSHIQMTYFVLWGLFFYYLLSSIFIVFKDKNPVKGGRLSIYFWISIAVGLGIGLVQIFPSMMYIRDAFSVRGVDRGFEFASSWSLHWQEAFSMIVPEFANTLDYYWGQNPFKLNSEYAGSITLFLAVLAVVSNPNRWRIFWISLAGFSLLFSLGAHTPVFSIAYYIVPGVKKFRACSMIMFWFSFSTILLASLFLKDLILGKITSFSEKKLKNWNKGLYIATGAVFVVTLIASSKGLVSGLFASELQSNDKSSVFDMNFSRNYLPGLWLWFIMMGISLATILGVVKAKIKPVHAVLAFLIIGLFDLLRVDAQFIKVIDPRPYFFNEPVITDLQEKMKKEPFRCFSLPGALAQNGEGIHGLEGVGGFHDNELRWYRDFRGDQQDRNYIMSLLGFNQDGQAYLNADKLSLGNPFLDIANAKYMLVRAENGLIAIENKNALGRVSFVSNYVVMDSSKIINALENRAYDYRTTIALTNEPQEKTVRENASVGSFAVLWQKYTPNFRKAQITIPENGYLRISEIYYPGWEVRIDKRKVHIYKADYAWMAVAVSRGTHEIEIVAHSNYLGKVEWISVVILSLYFLYGIVMFVKPKRNKRKIGQA